MQIIQTLAIIDVSLTVGLILGLTISAKKVGRSFLETCIAFRDFLLKK